MSTPIDAALSVLKPEEDVRKFLPLVIPAAAAIYGGIQGAKNVRENKISEPILGTKVAEGDDSLGSTALQFGSGLAEGFLPTKFGKFGAKQGGKALARRRAGKHATAQGEAAEAAAKHADMSARQSRALAQSRNPEIGYVFGPSTPTLPPSQVGAARTAAQRAAARVERLSSPGLGSRTLTGLGQPMGRLGVGVGGLATGAGIAYGGKQIADALGNMSMGGGGSGMGGGGSGMGGGGSGQGQFSLAGDPSAGNQNLQNVGVGQTGREQIWQQGGSGTFGKGETMTFTHYEGNEMLLKTLENLDKMHCGTEQKAECPKCGKNCKCDEEKKADDGDKKKKPAHGMVIVIGSKNAGPGPSTDGKRDSKD